MNKVLSVCVAQDLTIISVEAINLADCSPLVCNLFAININGKEVNRLVIDIEVTDC